MKTLFLHRRQLLFAGVGAAVLAQSAWGQNRSRGLEISTLYITLDEADSMRHLPLYLAQSLGFFDQEQLQVRLIHVPTDSQSLEQQAQVRSEVFAGSFERVLYLHAQGLSNQAFLMLTRSPGVVLLTKGQSAVGPQGLGSLAELTGLRWGVGPQGGLSHRVAMLSLLRAGMKINDVQWKHAASETELLKTLDMQKVDVVGLTDLAATQLERAANMRVLLDTRTQRDTDWLYGGSSAGVTLSASNSFIDRNPLTIQAVTQAVLKAMVWMRTASPTDLTRHVPKTLLETNSPVFFSAWSRAREGFSSDGVLPDGAAVNMLKGLQRLQLVSDVSTLNPANTFNNRFAIRSRQQLRA